MGLRHRGRLQTRAIICSLLTAVVADGNIAPATNGYMYVQGLDASVSGSGTSPVGSVNVKENGGYIQLQGHNFYVLAYQSQRGFGGYDLVDALAVRQDGGEVALFYLYCQGSRLTSVWHESYFMEAKSVSAAGSCAVGMSSLNSRAYFPAITALPPAFVSGFSISGSEVDLNGASGRIRAADGVWRTFTPFAKVDCTQCPGGSWYEVHGIFNNQPEDACFGILYLRLSNYHAVSLGWSLCLPELKRVDKVFSATWSHSMAESQAGFVPSSALPWRMPPWLAENSSSIGSLLV